MNKERTYICIDLKSFYASVECAYRHLDPLTTNLVVADTSRTEKTICLAVSPSLKAYGLKGRARLFEVIQKVEEINRERKKNAPNHRFLGDSISSVVLDRSPELKLNYIAATPQMAKYIQVSTQIYHIYLKYVAKEDIHVYSIDEVFMDVTHYLKAQKKTAHELAMTMIQDVLKTTGITATAGIGTNMYLAKVAMDIVAKHIPADKDGVRIAQLDELSYRHLLWNHKPLTDFWRVGAGYVRRLEALGIYTMGDIAKCSLGGPKDHYNEDLLYKEFGINAELLIDHAWGYEPTRMSDIKAYKPSSNSLSSGQVLHCPYSYEKTKIILKEMCEDLSLDLVSKKLMTNHLGLYVGYDKANLNEEYEGEVVLDYLGRNMPKAAHGSIALEEYTSTSSDLRNAILSLYERIINKSLSIRRINISANFLKKEEEVKDKVTYTQTSLFADPEKEAEEEKKRKENREKEEQVEKAMLLIKQKYGKNSILKGTNYQKGANGRERNNQIGGHKA